MRVHFVGSVRSELRSNASTTPNSTDAACSGSGTSPSFSNSAPLWMTSVASPPSSRIMFGPSPSGQESIWSVHHQYSSSDSPFQANTGTPCGSSSVPWGPMATAAAAWSWVEKMLHDAHRTSAPSSTSVSMSTAVWIVMCSEPEMRAPASGLLGPNSARRARRPGISCSARWISLRPNGASETSATRKSRRAGGASVVVTAPKSTGLSSRSVRDPADQDPASDCLMNSNAAMGPGSTPACSAIAIDMRSP